MKKNYLKKIIAPVIIIALLIIYVILWALMWSIIPFPKFFKILAFFIAGGVIAVSVYVLVERIEEIKSGEEDDISKY